MGKCKMFEQMSLNSADVGVWLVSLGDINCDFWLKDQ